MDTRTTRDLVSEIRSQVDEQNTAARDDDAILTQASRGVREVVHILASRYPALVLAPTPYSLILVSGQQDYAMPPETYEGKVVYIEIDVPGAPQRVYKHDFHDATRLAAAGATPSPYTWDARGRYIHFHQAPTGTYGARIYYVRSPDTFVQPEGRVTNIAGDGSYVVVTALDDDHTPLAGVTAATDELDSFVNVVSWLTGEVKATLQVQSIANDKVTFRSVPTRSSVLGRTISATVPATVEKDDYLCVSRGTCVPQFDGAMYNFFVDFGVAALSRSLGGDYMSQFTEAVLTKGREMVEDVWAGTEIVDRVVNRSSQWPSVTRRFPWPTRG